MKRKIVHDGDEHETIKEMIPAYALYALDEDEAVRVNQHLATCVICQEELAAYEGVADSLPLAIPEVAPSTELKRQLFARIEKGPERETAVTTQTTTASTAISQTIRNWLAGPFWRPVALAVGVVALILGIVLWQQLSFSNSIRFEQFVMTNTAAAPEATGLIIMGEDGNFGTLVVDRLPELSEEQQYQLWLIKDGERVSGGIFSVYESGYQSIKVNAPDPLSSYTSFGITIEPAGGSEGPTGVRVLGYNL